MQKSMKRNLSTFCIMFAMAIGFAICAKPLFAQELQEVKVEVPQQDDDPKLGEKLIRKAVKGEDEDVMDRIAELMAKAAERLEVQLDASKETQTVQQDVLKELDKAIKVAAAQRRPKPQPQQSSSSDRREASKQQSKDKPKSKDQQGAAADASSNNESKQAEQAKAAGDLTGGSLKESRRTWGALPDRERDEIIQGLGEGYVEKYKAWIEKYYRALQENDN